MPSRTLLLKQIAIIGLFLGATIVLGLPAIARLQTDVIGAGGDPWQAMWRFEDKWGQAKTAMATQSIFPFIQHEFFGAGPARLVNLSVWPWMWLQPLVGQPLAFNIVWLVSFVAAGYGMYHLVRLLTSHLPSSIAPAGAQEAGAIVAGLFYMLLPFHIAHAQGHFGAMQLGWLVWICVATLALFKKPMFVRSLLLILLVVGQAWTEHHYLLWLGILAVLAGLFYVSALRDWWQEHSRSRFLVVGTFLIAAALVGFSYLPTIRQATTAGSSLALGVQQSIRFSADLFSYVLPAPFHPWWGSTLYTIYGQHFTGNVAEATQFLGFVPLLLVLFFYHRLPERHKHFWALTAAAFAIISFGPRLHVFGYVTPIPLPYALLQELPVFSAVRAVARAGVMVGLSMSVLLGLVLATQARRAVSFIIVALLIVAEFLFFPTATQSAATNAVYPAVTKLSGESIVEVPAATNYDLASRALYASNHHGKIVLDNIALERGNTTESIGKLLPAVRQLLYVRTTDIRDNRLEFFGQDLAESFTDVVAGQKIAAVIIHPDSLSAFQVTALRNFLEKTLGLTAEVYDDTLLYPLQNLKTAGDGIYAIRGEGWDSVGFDKNRQSYFAEIPREAQLRIFNTEATPVTVAIHFTIPPESHPGIHLMQAGQAVILNQSNNRDVSAIVTLQPGENSIEFSSALPDKVIIQNPTLEVID